MVARAGDEGVDLGASFALELALDLAHDVQTRQWRHQRRLAVPQPLQDWVAPGRWWYDQRRAVLGGKVSQIAIDSLSRTSPSIKSAPFRSD